jgi:hypothetical protein
MAGCNFQKAQLLQDELLVARQQVQLSRAAENERQCFPIVWIISFCFRSNVIELYYKQLKRKKFSLFIFVCKIKKKEVFQKSYFLPFYEATLTFMGSVLIRSIANNVLQYIAIHCQFVLANTMYFRFTKVLVL